MLNDRNHNSKTGESQNMQILRGMMGGKSYTALEALQEFGCFRLAARIYDIEREFGVKAERAQVICYSSGKLVEQYWLNRDQIEFIKLGLGVAA